MSAPCFLRVSSPGAAARRRAVCWLAAVLWVGLALPAAAQSNVSLDAARDLYNAAAYSDALSMLDKVGNARPLSPDAVEAQKYRAFCLVALGRTGEAQDVIAELLAAQPSFRLAEADVSRRVLTLFDETRRRALPGIVQAAYDRAKRAYERQDLMEARSSFELVVALAADPDIPSDARLVKDVARLARDFLDLIRLNAPPVSSRPLAFRSPVAPATKSVYDGSDREIVPPVVLEQRLPPLPPGLRTPPGTAGVVELTIDERGEVESAVMAPPFNTAYDDVLIEAARHWRYRPALCGRQPVKYRRRVQIVAGTPGGPQDPEGHAQDAPAR